MKHLFVGRTQSAHIQFFRYLFVGASSALVDLGVYSWLVKIVGIDPYFSAFVGYGVGLAWNYIVSLLWIFQSKHDRHKEIVAVIAIAIGGLLWTWLIIYLLYDLLGIDEVIAKAISQVIVLGWNFGMRKWVVFQ